MHWQLSCEELIILFLTTPFFFRESFRKHGVGRSVTKLVPLSSVSVCGPEGASVEAL